MLKKLVKYVFIIAVLSSAAVIVLVVQPTMPVGGNYPAVTVKRSDLEYHVRVLSKDIYPRCYQDPEQLQIAATYIRKHFEQAGGRVLVQKFPVDELEFSNIIAEFGPEGGPLLIVGAHYDAYGDDFPRLLPTPGADDNASGVAGLLVLADLLGEHPPKKRVQLVAYCLEEPPFFRTDKMGSAHHAAAMHEQGDEIIGVISLEMIGYFSDAEGSQTYPHEIMSLVYPTTGDFISIVGRFQDIPLTRKVKAAMGGATELPVYSINALPLIPGIDFSDHYNYWPYGYEAVMITDTAFYRNFSYHTKEDVADSLDYARMSMVVRGVFAAIMALTEE